MGEIEVIRALLGGSWPLWLLGVVGRDEINIKGLIAGD
jgi:hypothetical protein